MLPKIETGGGKKIITFFYYLFLIKHCNFFRKQLLRGSAANSVEIHFPKSSDCQNDDDAVVFMTLHSLKKMI